jgi:glutaredoxin
MGLLDKVGKLAMDAIDSAARTADRVQQKVDPLIERSELASRIRDRMRTKHESIEVPDPEPNESPFVTHEDSEVEDDKPLANPALAAQIYGRGTDPWTGRALQLLTDHGVEHEFVDLEGDGGLKIETRLLRETGQEAAPYIFLRGELVGGYNALSEIVRLGQLDEMVKPLEERGKGAGRTRIVIQKRGADEVPPGERGA